MTNDRLKGFTYGALAAASYGLNPLFALPLYGAGMKVDSVLFYRYFFAIVMLGILMKVKKQSFALKKTDILPLAVMGLLFSFSSLFLFESYNYMDAGIASTILFVYPVMVAIIMAIFFHEKVSFITMFSIALAFTGISLLYEGGDGRTLNLLGVLFVILSSLTYAIYIVGVNRSSLKNLPTAKLTFYALLFGIIIYVVHDEEKRKSLVQSSGELLNELLTDEGDITETESSIELNLYALKMKRTVKRTKKG